MKVDQGRGSSTRRGGFIARARIITTVGCVLLAGAAGAWYAVEAGQSRLLAGDTRLVVRISKQAMADLLQSEIREEFPIDEQTDAFHVTGTADALGKIWVTLDPELDPATGHAVFVVHVDGGTDNDFESIRSPVRIVASGKGEFQAEQRVRFDGREFFVDPPQITAQHETEIEGVEPLPGTPLKGIVRLMAVRDARKAIPDFNELAERRIRERLAKRIDGMLQDVLAQLREDNPIGETLAKLHPGVLDGRIELTANEDSVQAALVPSGGAAPRLPLISQQPGAGFDVWIRLTDSQQFGLDLLHRGGQSHQVLGWFLPEAQAQLAAAHAAVTQSGDWTRLRIDADAPPRTVIDGAAPAIADRGEASGRRS